MSYFFARSRSPRAGRLLDARCAGALCGTLLALLLLAHMLFRPRAEQPFATPGWTGADFLEHLRRRGVQLHLVRGASHGGPCNHVYLTEDPDATWLDLQSKLKDAEHIDQWHGTVWVGSAFPGEDVQEALARLGPYGCRIGDFLLFGDEDLLRRIQAACREPGGW